MLNQTVITGNLGEDPKDFFTSDGIQVTNFNLAFQSGKKKTCWIKVVCFKKLAELASKYLHKGARIAISGTLDQDKWIDKDEKNHTTFQLLGNTIEFIRTDGRGFKEGETTPETINEEVPF
jgi:single-strand DNA-binding protein